MVYNSRNEAGKSISELVWNNTNEALFTIGHDGRILSAIPSFMAILGWSQEDLSEMNCFPFFADISQLRMRSNYPYSNKDKIFCIM